MKAVLKAFFGAAAKFFAKWKPAFSRVSAAWRGKRKKEEGEEPKEAGGNKARGEGEVE